MPTNATDGPAADREHLERSREVWDDRSDKYDRSERDFAPMLDAAVEDLAVGRGDTVLEIGCGPGTNLRRIADLIGPEGRIVAVDYSPAMAARARERAAGVETQVDVLRADASSVAFERGAFDAALASLSMSVLPDPAAGAARVREALEPGGRFVVFDVRPFPAGPQRILNPLVRRFYRWYANWNADEDVLASVEAAFGDVAVRETHLAGAAYRAVATNRGE